MLMDGRVSSEFRVEGGGEDAIFLDERGSAIEFGKYGNAGGDAFDDGSTDEDHLERIFFESGGAKENIAGELAAVGVAENGHVEEAEGRLLGVLDMSGEKDRASTSAEDGAVRGSKFTDRLEKPFLAEELKLRCAFPAGKNQGIGLAQIGDGADFERGSAESREHRRMGSEVTLNS